MKVFQKKLLAFISAVAISSFLSGCSDSASTDLNNIGPGKERVEAEVSTLEGDQFELLQQASEEYLQSASFDSVQPSEVYKKVMFGDDEDFLIVDVREMDAFANGNIEGSINIPYSLSAEQSLIENLPKEKKLIVVCYSGHTASQTAALWNMLGYNAIPMEYGMGGWTTIEGLGAPFIKEPFEFIVETNNVQSTSIYDFPNIEKEIASINDLILEQSKEYLSSGKGAVIQAPVVMEKIEANDKNIFLLDIRNLEHYQKGHVPNAINIPIDVLANLENLAKLPTDKQIITIGYNANDASIATRVLNQLGYNAVAMHSGMRVWTSDKSITGTTSIPVSSLGTYPVKDLNYNLDGESAEASCS